MDTHVKVMFGIPLAVIAALSMMNVVGGNADAMHEASDAKSMVAEVDVEAPGSETLAAKAPAAVASVAPPAKPQPVKMTDLDEAEKAIRLAINLSGHLCAKPTEVREVGPNLYGVHCITNRDGTGGSNYLVNSRTNEVDEI